MVQFAKKFGNLTVKEALYHHNKWHGCSRKGEHQGRYNRWFQKENSKEPRYYCFNCGRLFRTGRFSRKDSMVYDDVCPYCEAIGSTFTETVEYFKEELTERSKNENSD